MTLWEKTKIITESYADPEMASKYLGLWKGEVYEFAAVFLLLNKGFRQLFQLQVWTTFGSQANIVVNTRLLELSLMGLEVLLINKGIFRTSAEGDIYEPLPVEKEEDM
jgi:hypothetical protein